MHFLSPHAVPGHRLRMALTMIVAVMALSFTACHDDMPDGVENSLYDEVQEKDNFVGSTRSITLGAQGEEFPYKEFVLGLLAPDGSIIKRAGTVDRSRGAVEARLINGLKDGQYRLLYLEYDRHLNSELDKLPERFERARFGLGSRIEIKEGSVRMLDSYNQKMGLCGDGTIDNPFVISSDDQMIKLMMKVNSAATNKDITSETYISQVVPIDMDMASFSCDMRYGWYPIGCDVNLPFRGVFLGNEITNLWCDRPASPGVGLFGFIYNSAVKNVKIKDSEFTGNYAVGSVVGAVISGGDDHGKSVIADCSVRNTTVVGSDGSFAVGGIAGAVDMYGNLLLTGCSNDSSRVSGSYNVGGILGGGARRSTTMIASCYNRTPITGEYSGTGGIVGACDTLNVTACTNFAPVKGAVSYSGATDTSGVGTGGIAGGAGMCALTSVVNHGDVSGADGTGGLIGSTRIAGGNGNSYVYNNCIVRGGGNNGKVSGNDYVGGAMGEGQFGCYGFYNEGAVTGRDYVAGTVGDTSISSVHNAVNTGAISGRAYVAGIMAKTTMGMLATSHNYGKVSASDHHAGGIVGLAGNNTVLHYCGNFAQVLASNHVGGIVGEIGDPRKWSGANIADCVVGGLEIAFAVLGPALSVTSMAIHSAAHVAAIGIHILEVTLEGCLLLTDSGLLLYGLYEIFGAEGAELQDDIHADMTAIRNDIDSRITSIRNAGNAEALAAGYDPAAISAYPPLVDKVNKYVEQEGNDETFYENLNLMREERAEELEAKKHAGEIAHEIVGGLAVAVSAVSAVCALVASGGTAAPFIVTGSLMAIVGGVNAITKATGDFQVNSAIVSQCINAGAVSGDAANTAGIVGELQDGCLVEYCVNAVDMPTNYQPFAAKCHKHAEIQRSVSAGKTSTSSNSGYTLSAGDCSNLAIRTDKDVSSKTLNESIVYYGCYLLSQQAIGDSKSYDTGWEYYDSQINTIRHVVFKISEGSDGLMIVPAVKGNSFPVPNKSRVAAETLLYE